MRLLGLIFTASMLLGGCASMRVPANENASLEPGPAVRDFRSPYEPVLDCLRSQLTPDQRNKVFGVTAIDDRSGRLNYVAEGGVGTFSSQGLYDRMMVSLFRSGVRATNLSPGFRSTQDWVLTQGAAAGHRSTSLAFPDYTIQGSVSAIDFVPLGGWSAQVRGVRLGQTQNRINIVMSMSLTAVASFAPNGTPGGQIVAYSSPEKQIEGSELSTGATSFVGPNGSPSLVDLDLGRRRIEALQRTEHFMIDRVVYDLVSSVFSITACEPQRQYVENTWGGVLR